MIDGRNVFDQPVKDDIKSYENISKITTGQEDDWLLISCYNSSIIQNKIYCC